MQNHNTLLAFVILYTKKKIVENMFVKFSPEIVFSKLTLLCGAKIVSSEILSGLINKQWEL